MAPRRGELRSLRQQLLDLRQRACDLEQRGEDEIALVDASRAAGARNLVDYLALRQSELSELQRSLQRHGLSSLGAVQAHVMASLEAVLDLLDGLCNERRPPLDTSRHPSIIAARAQLEAFADETLGPYPPGGAIRIMVTMPSEAAVDPGIADALLAQGMTVMRINCAHDGPDAWRAMIRHLHDAERRQGRRCPVSFDLAGPKLRTGPIEEGPEVVRFKPTRDALGRVTAPARITFAPSAADDDRHIVPLSESVCHAATGGDEIHVRDARGRHRMLTVDEVAGSTLQCSTDHTVYLMTGTSVEVHQQGGRVAGTIGVLPALESSIDLEAGDTLIMTRDMAPGRPAAVDDDDHVIEPARIGCSLPDVFDAIEAGHRVLLDDGKFEGVVLRTTREWFEIEIRRAGRGRAKLKAEKGVNLPDTPLGLAALTEQDVRDLRVVAEHGALVALSFVHTPRDIARLYEELDRLGADHLGVVLKIENSEAFARLPQLIMEASKRRRIAVMVARGDLGVEIGFERLAEVQEEILWLAEAAQVPVIWATQVLESLAKDGLPSRAEVTDAAMSTRAECVMLNKGPHIGEAIRFLSDVARRMRRHTAQTFSTHRRLEVAASGWLDEDHSNDDRVGYTPGTGRKP